MSVGETFEIYYSGNSYSQYCLVNKKSLKKVQELGRKIVKSARKNCDGCSHVGAFVFMAKEVGIDTILLNKISPTQNCEDDYAGGTKEMYFVNVK